MVYANFAEDLSHLTILLVAILVFIVIWWFKSELRALLHRMSKSKLRAHHRGVTVEADLEDREEAIEEEPRAAPPTTLEDTAENAPETSGDSLDPPLDRDRPPESNPEAIRVAMIQALANGDKQEGDKRYEELKNLVDDPIERKSDKVQYLAGLFQSGLDQSALPQMRELAQDPEVAFVAHQNVGFCLRQAGLPSEAASAFLDAKNAARDSFEIAEAAVLRGEALADLNQADVAIEELERLQKEGSDQRTRQKVWEGLAVIYEKAGEKLLAATAGHQAAELAVNDARKWFYAGWGYASAGIKGTIPLAVHCYRTAIRFDPSLSGAENNLGVELTSADLPMVGMDFHRAAANQGNTLAMANIGKAYFQAGFAEDAKRTLEEAASTKGAHANVAANLASLVKEQERQQKTFDDLKSIGERVASFMASHADASLEDDPGDLDPKWNLDDNTRTELERSGSSVVVTWEEGPEWARRGRRFRGTLRGASVTGRFQIKKPFNDAWEVDGTGFGVLASDKTSFRLMRIQGIGVEEVHMDNGG